jgi:hypothetical protein
MAIWARWARLMPAVTARKSGASPGGSIVTNSVTNAEMSSCTTRPPIVCRVRTASEHPARGAPARHRSRPIRPLPAQLHKNYFEAATSLWKS